MKNKIKLYLGLFFLAFLVFQSCKTSSLNTTSNAELVQNSKKNSSKMIDEKSGAQLWGENCVRCHNVPPPQAYSNEQWVVIKQHMKVRANISQQEIDKIFEFIKNANNQ